MQALSAHGRQMKKDRIGENGRCKLAARTSRAIANARKDWCRRTGGIIANTAPGIVIEDLSAKNMTASARGTTGKPGENVRQKAGLNQKVLGSGRHQLEQTLGYGVPELTKVPAAYTSQICDVCGLIDISSYRT